MKVKAYKKAKSAAAGGTFLMGYLCADFASLKKMFGKPIGGDGYKVDAEWVLQDSDGGVVTVYNWKDGPNYLGEEGMAVPLIMKWHIGAKESTTFNRFLDYLTKNNISCTPSNF